MCNFALEVFSTVYLVILFYIHFSNGLDDYENTSPCFYMNAVPYKHYSATKEEEVSEQVRPVPQFVSVVVQNTVKSA